MFHFESRFRALITKFCIISFTFHFYVIFSFISCECEWCQSALRCPWGTQSEIHALRAAGPAQGKGRSAPGRSLAVRERRGGWRRLRAPSTTSGAPVLPEEPLSRPRALPPAAAARAALPALPQGLCCFSSPAESGAGWGRTAAQPALSASAFQQFPLEQCPALIPRGGTGGAGPCSVWGPCHQPGCALCPMPAACRGARHAVSHRLQCSHAPAPRNSCLQQETSARGRAQRCGKVIQMQMLQSAHRN